MSIHTINAFFLGLLFYGSIVYAQPNNFVTQGLGTTTIPNLLPGCPSNHITPLGTITSSDGTSWVVPAETNFQTGPYCFDLFNSCNGVTPANLSVSNWSNASIVEIDPEGEVITGFLFSDNYFELYINGVLIGVDPIPFTPFNSCIVKFRVSTPYTIAVKLVDWEENLGIGSEINNGNNYHPGDGGFIAQFSDGTVTDSSWKAQTFYISPIQDLDSVIELPDGTHSTASATTSPTCDTSCYAIHYQTPSDWMNPNFDEVGWPSAVVYSSAEVTNQAAFKNFETTAWPDAQFIWTSNLILDNLVLARKTVGTTAVSDLENRNGLVVKNPFSDFIILFFQQDIFDLNIRLFDSNGAPKAHWPMVSGFSGETMNLVVPGNLPAGIYFLLIHDKNTQQYIKLIHLIS